MQAALDSLGEGEEKACIMGGEPRYSLGLDLDDAYTQFMIEMHNASASVLPANRGDRKCFYAVGNRIEAQDCEIGEA